MACIGITAPNRLSVLAPQFEVLVDFDAWGSGWGRCIAGLRAELIEDFPQLTHEDVLACFGFAAERERRLLALPAA
jgi:hypothetical protein